LVSVIGNQGGEGAEMDFLTFGRHITVDAWGIQHELINDVELLTTYMVDAANTSGATVLSTRSQKFKPQGVSVLVLLSESHLTIHTYPKKGFAAIDCYTCGECVNPQVAVDHLLDQLKPEKIFVKGLVRGIGEIQMIPAEAENVQ
jgi:S-adenosylmethionine decarboxylase